MKHNIRHMSLYMGYIYIYKYTYDIHKCIYIHPRKLTWNPKMRVWKMFLLFKWVFFGFHVSFLRCTSYVHHSLDSLDCIPQISPRKSAGNKGRDELAAKGPRKQATQKTNPVTRNVSPCGRVPIVPLKKSGVGWKMSLFLLGFGNFSGFCVLKSNFLVG